MIKEYFLGIDDAGRGPIIGPMVLAGIIISKNDECKLKEIGVKDSKLVSDEKRKKIQKHLVENFSYCVELAFPDEIDLRTRAGTNLNLIEAIKSASVVNNLMKKNSEKVKVIIDCPSPNTESWRNYVLNYIYPEFKERIELLCEHKADFNHVSCSAASIIAKCHREEEIEKLKKEIGIDFGSGYPADPLTIKFLEENLLNFKDKGLFRTTWDTYTKAIAKSEQKKLF